MGFGLLIVSPAIAAQAATANEGTRSVDAVNAVEEHWSRAFIGGDTAYLDRLLADDYVSVTSKGVPHSKDEVIAASKKYAASNPPAFAPNAPSPVALHGDIAIVKHRSDKDVSVDVFQFRSGHWIALYSQHTMPVAP